MSNIHAFLWIFVPVMILHVAIEILVDDEQLRSIIMAVGLFVVAVTFHHFKKKIEKYKDK